MLRPTLVVAMLATVAAGIPAAQRQTQTPAFKLDKAAILDQITNDQKRPLVAQQGMRFVWIKATALKAPQTIDLTKVEITGTPSKLPLVGVDSAFDGDPTQFSMIAAERIKNGPSSSRWKKQNRMARSSSRSPGKTATLKFLTGTPSVCLLFAVFPGFTTARSWDWDRRRFRCPRSRQAGRRRKKDTACRPAHRSARPAQKAAPKSLARRCTSTT